MEKEVKCEVFYSNVISRVEENKVVFYRKVIGYIRAYDKSVNLGEKVIQELDMDTYRTLKKQLQKDWEDVRL